ncbi:MAG TPA: ThiF family adenylyltransferase [Anaerolineales bacterium]|nr:ThiF family adenylyltransferase [Anaerolineales bacterium]
MRKQASKKKSSQKKMSSKSTSLMKLPTLNKDALYARSILLPVVKDITIHLIGCGGSGSWLAPHLARITKLLQDVHHLGVRLVFWDHDTVEEKNIFRQNFCEAEIEINKAETLARRFGLAWGIEIIAVNAPFSRDSMYRNSLGARYGDNSMPVFLTCVDNNKARQEVAKACSENYGWWLDTGNIKTAGQVSIGRGLAPREPSPLRFPSMTTWTPLPSVQFPGILQEEEKPQKEEVDYSGMSCADIALVDEQGLSINHAIASTAAAMLMKLLVTKDLQHHCAYVSIDSGTTFVYNSPRILTDYLKNIEFVSVEGAEEYDDQEDMEQAMLDEEDGEEPLFEEDLPETAEEVIGLA